MSLITIHEQRKAMVNVLVEESSKSRQCPICFEECDSLVQACEVEEERMKRKEQRDHPVHRSFTKFKKQAAAFAQTALDDQRTDVANTVIGMLGVVQRQLGDD